MLIICGMFLRIEVVLESVLDTEDSEVGKTDLALALMVLTMGEKNINQNNKNNKNKQTNRLLQAGFPQEAASELSMKVCLVTTTCGKE